jgi:segregation and condensation protein B
MSVEDEVSEGEAPIGAEGEGAPVPSSRREPEVDDDVEDAGAREPEPAMTRADTLEKSAEDDAIEAAPREDEEGASDDVAAASIANAEPGDAPSVDEGPEPEAVIADATPVDDLGATAPRTQTLEAFLAVDDALDPEEYRSRDEGSEPAAEGDAPSTEADLDAIVEALLFVADKPLKPADLAERAHCSPEALRETILRLQEVYATRGIRLVAVANGFAFRTAPEVSEYVREATAQRPVKLTRAQLETLAILAYRQPMTRPEIDDVRGVDSGPVLKLLLERHLVRILGKKEEPGRPLLYGTTSLFLELFGLRTLRDLPTLREFTELTEESRRTMEKKLMGEETPVEGDAPKAEGAANAATGES